MKAYAAGVLATVLGVVICGVQTARADLVAYWPLNQGPEGPISSGTIFNDRVDHPVGDEVDATAADSNGSYTNDAELGRMVWRTADYCRADAGKTEMNRDFTWSLWAKSVGGSAGSMMGTRDGSYARLTPNSIAADGYGISFAFPNQYNDDTWHHFVFQRTNDTFKVYVDGVFEASRTKAAGDNNMRLEIGGHQAYSNYFDGYMSQVAIWDEALSEARIQDLASGGPVDLPPGTMHSQK